MVEELRLVNLAYSLVMTVLSSQNAIPLFACSDLRSARYLESVPEFCHFLMDNVDNAGKWGKTTCGKFEIRG
jgi:hypothetical protein